MKKILIALKILLTLFIVLLMISFSTLWIDSLRTEYLTIDKRTASANNSYLIQNANILPMDQDTVLLNKMVYIKQGIIAAIADSIQVDEIPVFDAKNSYLTPGLIDMHTHVWDRYELGLYLSNGVTAVRNLWGMPLHLRMKEDIANSQIYGPSFFTTGPKLTGIEFIGEDNINLSTTEQAKDKVRLYKKRGYDFIKTYYGLDKQFFDAIIEQAQASNIDIVAHPSQKVPFSYHLHSQIKSIEHAEEIVQQPLQFDLDALKLQTIIDSIAASRHTSYCPTIVGFNNIYQMMTNNAILDSAPVSYINPFIKTVDSKKQFNRWFNAKKNDATIQNRIKNQHDFHLLIVQKLHESGVNIICGTDSGIGITSPGFSIHQELNFYKKAGLSNYEVLKTATVNAANTHTIMNSLGTIEVGKVANLLILDKNPLVDLASLQNPSAVFVHGRMIDQKTLKSFDTNAKNRKNLMATALYFVENILIEK